MNASWESTPLAIVAAFSRLLAICGLLAGCAANPIHNVPLIDAAAPRYDFKAWIESRELDENLILVSFSGGGVRAGALAASVGQELVDLRLDHQVALISSTSGGSVTAGFIAAQGFEGLKELNTRFLKHDNQGELTPMVIGGILTGANRSQRFAAYLDERLFDGKPVTYGALRQRWAQSPFVILNASDMSSGSTFEFTQASFDTLCSDLNSFRLSESIAASAAFPFLMSPITLRNHWDVRECREGPAPFSQQAFEDAKDYRYFDLERFVAWRHRHALRYTYESNPKSPPYRQIQYVHLLDGGLSDNLAARALLRAFAENAPLLLKKKVQRVLLIQVNAKSDPPQDIDQSASTPSMINVFKSVALNPIDVTTALSSYISREYMVATVNSLNHQNAINGGLELNFYPVQVDFDQLKSLTDQARAKALGTSWALGEDDVDFLGGLGRTLLRDHPCFQAFAHDAKIAVASTKEAGACDKYINLRLARGDGGNPPAAVIAHGAPPTSSPPPPMSEKITFAADAFFDFDKAVLKPEARDRLDLLVTKSWGIDVEVFIVVGHTDSSGAAAHNMQLSMDRAEAVKRYLLLRGVAAKRVYTEGQGDKMPVGDNATKEGRAKNRRVDIEVVGTRRQH